MFVERRRHPVADAQLQATIGAQPAMQGGGLFDQEAVMTGLVDALVKNLVQLIVHIRRIRIACRFTGPVRFL